MSVFPVSGPHSFCVSEEFRLTSVGKEMFGVETKIDKPDADGNGEVSKNKVCQAFQH